MKGARRVLVGALVAALLSMTSKARADVDLTACPGLDAAELKRVLALEIATLARSSETLPPFELSLACEPTRVTMVLVDLLTQKKLERSIPAPRPNEPGRERLLALAASQLLVASWLELLVADRPPSPPPTDAPPKPIQPPAARVAEQAAIHSVSNQDSSFAGELRGGAMVRGLSAPVPMLHVGLDAGLAFGERYRAFLRLGFESGGASRLGGSVAARTGALGLGAAVSTRRLGPLALEARFAASLLYVRIEGRAASSRYVGRAVDGVTGDLALAVGPNLALGALRLGLDAMGGVTLPAPEGKVVGDASVKLDGPWFGGALTLGLAAR